MYRRIRDLREDKDLKQKDLAKHLGCSQTTYSDYETGKIPCAPGDIDRTIQVLPDERGLSAGSDG